MLFGLYSTLRETTRLVRRAQPALRGLRIGEGAPRAPHRRGVASSAVLRPVMLDLWWRAFSTFFRWSSGSDTDKEVKADERRPCILAVHLGVRPSLTQPSWSCRHRLAVNVQTHSCVRGIRRGSQPTLPRRSISRSVVAKDYGATVDDSSPVRSVALLERTRGVLEASAALQWTR